MYYEEQSRRINLLSGFVAGTVLGVGLALLIQPEGPGARRHKRRGGGGRAGGGGTAALLRSAAERGLEMAAHRAASRAVKRFRL